ncbi:MAG: type III-A CRISPR-associated RAMP protein Csm4 [Syntrophales bacterium]
MRTYLIDLATPSAFITPWQADTLFGHLCWAAERHDGFKHFKGAAGLIDFFRSNNPPFILSDGYPAGLLPTPITLKNLYQPTSQDDLNLDRYGFLKRAKKKEYLTLEQFQVFQRGGIPNITDDQKGFVSATTLHNQLNRLTNTTGNQGSLFELDERFTPHGRLHIYAKVRDGWVDDLQRLFECFIQAGYGAKKSVGKGACKIESIEPFDGFELSMIKNEHDQTTTSFVTLSHFVPASNDPTDGAYKVMVKYGKLGEEKTYCGQPFKKPLILLKPGAVFKCARMKPYYGRLIENITYADPSVVQYGFAFPVEILAT